MTTFLLDTNILSDLIRNPGGKAARKIAQIGFANVAASIVVTGELRFGGAKKQSPVLIQKIEELLDTIAVLPLDEPVDAVYADLRATLEGLGKPIGANDLFIAAHALVLSATLVTDNEREFSRVAGLKIENWLR